ncbi:GDP-mannose 4,6-dehydratase [Flexilinea flocculi]|jgi:CDP-paratose 2-epimerase|uniref:dTDP-D-glucose 4,6-dehydratase n=1 Tax=Flexilinea flocculi TaxID=1678840 RepID=A0A0S7BVH9_9CHLR|nr:GDP-mannose 4,6-dehydratase [Flexilinea flocculi]NMB94158.1 NAD-dependent epimerase/dehydratase family protein [Flexilinea flocculi]GAP40832.1 dTDP-D-glucose 4,6-dehydratase [Flexilinea flocculi]
MTQTYFITGGAGFIGSNFVAHLLEKNQNVVIFDNLSRNGSKMNLSWLREQYGQDAFRLIEGDVRDSDALDKAMEKMDVVAHFAGQVAVTTSVMNPKEDFEVNALGTLNVLEAVRKSKNHPIVLYTSTNKVYGGMENVRVIERENDYAYLDFPQGISENQLLDFHSPYGCSKGTGDQYVRDYHRIYGIPTIVFRQSAIYGPHQFGIEDQGWVSWFIIAVLTGKPITIYGNGKQVRDLLYIEDLVRAYSAAIDHPEVSAGKIYNIGGGPENCISIWKDFGPILESLCGHPIEVAYGDWRPGDQAIYISDIRKIKQELGWTPTISAKEGITRLYSWASANRNLFG